MSSNIIDLTKERSRRRPTRQEQYSPLRVAQRTIDRAKRTAEGQLVMDAEEVHDTLSYLGDLLDEIHERLGRTAQAR